jgi:hypothetical protein
VLFPLLLTLAGLGCAFVPVYLGLWDLPVLVPLLLLAGGAGWGWATWFRRRDVRGSWARALTACGQVAALGLFSIWFFHLAAYGAEVSAPRPGDPAPLIRATRVKDGAAFRLDAQRGHGVLLVFFRGPW